MYNNTYETTITAPIDAVWFALTNSDEITRYTKNIEVISDWRVNADIEYTCYNDDGTIMEWNNIKMVWKWKIEVLDKNKEFTCIYSNHESGLTKESYFLEKIDQGTTKITLIQYAISQEIADSYRDGSSEMMNMFKSYLEK